MQHAGIHNPETKQAQQTCSSLAIGKNGSIVPSHDRLHNRLGSDAEQLKLLGITTIHLIICKAFCWLVIARFWVLHKHLPISYFHRHNGLSPILLLFGVQGATANHDLQSISCVY
jgi:hypothetical protein